MNWQIVVRPFRVLSDHVVEVEWVFPDGERYWERVSCPPKAVREARRETRDEATRDGLARAADAS